MDIQMKWPVNGIPLTMNWYNRMVKWLEQRIQQDIWFYLIVVSSYHMVRIIVLKHFLSFNDNNKSIFRILCNPFRYFFLFNIFLLLNVCRPSLYVDLSKMYTKKIINQPWIFKLCWKEFFYVRKIEHYLSQSNIFSSQ